MSIQAIGSSTTVDLGASMRTRATTENTSTNNTENSSAPQKSAGNPPVRIGATPKPVESSASTSNTSKLSTDKIYDKRDANQDGTVSYQEELLFAIKQASSENQNQAALTTNQVQAGLNAYKQGQQVNSTALTSTILAI